MDELHSINRNIAVSLTHQGKYDEGIKILNEAFNHFTKSEKYQKTL